MPTSVGEVQGSLCKRAKWFASQLSQYLLAIPATKLTASVGSEVLSVNGIGPRHLLERWSDPTPENAPSDRLTVGGPGYISPMRYQHPNKLYLSYLVSGSRRRWIVVGPNSKEKLENKLRSLCFGPMCPTRPPPCYLTSRHVENF